MKWLSLIVGLVIFFAVLGLVQAQTTTTDCPDKCENSTLYQKGILDLKTKICKYEYQEVCKYGCRISDTKIFEEPACNILPPNDTSTAFEKIYEELNTVKEQVYKISPPLFLHGTEYTTGDYATIFLQLKDNNGLSVNNGQCYIDIYYPSYENESHPILISNAPMLYQEDSNGLYFYDLYIPNVTGVYMLSATCSHAYDIIWIYAPEDLDKPNMTIIQGTYSGDTISLNDRTDFLYLECQAVGNPKICEEYYDFNISGVNNITQFDLYYSGESTASPLMKLYVYNWTNNSWIELTNSLIFSGTASPSPLSPSGIDEFVTNRVPVNGTIQNGIVRIKLYTTSIQSFHVFNNWLSMKFMTIEGTIQELKGSGEMHVNDWFANLTAFTTFSEGRYVGGTEYSQNETGQASVQFMRTIAGNPSPINDGTCNVTIYYPNNTKFINNQYAYYISGSNGIYSKNFTVPNTYGVYKTDFYCEKGGVKAYGSGSFHVSEWADTIFKINTTTGTINLKLENITTLIQNVNSSIHSKLDYYHNITINKLQEIQNNLTLIYNLIGDVNVTIMNKLYAIQDEISSLNETLINLPNITLNITLKQEEILDTLIALLGDKNVKQSYTSFAGFTPAIGIGGFGGFEEIQYYCKDNQTLVSSELINYTGDINKTYFRITERTCTYGCMNNSCVLPPYTIWATAFFIIIVIFFFFEYFRSKGYI